MTIRLLLNVVEPNLPYFFDSFSSKICLIIIKTVLSQSYSDDSNNIWSVISGQDDIFWLLYDISQIYSDDAAQML
jgi:hypothetical protein